MNVLITGGATGLGAAITRKLATAMPGSHIYFSYRSGTDAANELQSGFSNCSGIRCDFSDSGELERLASFIAENDIDILVNNAWAKFQTGYAHKTPIADVTDSFSRNVLPTIRLTQSFITAARKRKSGRIITILSASLDAPPTGWGVYVAEKMYLLGMHKLWAKENAVFGISSNCISPAFILTPLHKDMDERLIEDMTARHPLKRLLRAEEVADVVHFLAMATPQINGQNFIISEAT